MNLADIHAYQESLRKIMRLSMPARTALAFADAYDQIHAAYRPYEMVLNERVAAAGGRINEGTPEFDAFMIWNGEALNQEVQVTWEPVLPMSVLLDAKDMSGHSIPISPDLIIGARRLGLIKTEDSEKPSD